MTVERLTVECFEQYGFTSRSDALAALNWHLSHYINASRIVNVISVEIKSDPPMGRYSLMAYLLLRPK